MRRRPSPLLAALSLVTLATLGLVRAAAAADAAFVIELDRDAVAPGEPFICQVTLTTANEDADGYRAPDFKGLRVLSAPQYPSRSTQMQINGGQTTVQSSYSWSYQLMVPPGAKGPFVIGGARARLGSREIKSNTINVRVGKSTGGAAAPSGRQRGGGFPFDLFGGGQPEPQPQSTASSGTFIRAVADKTRVYVGEPVVVTWSICTGQNGINAAVTSDARTDGFWSEDVPSTVPRGSSTAQTIAGQTYQVSTLSQKALFPLREGKLTITPMEVDAAQVDFFGMAVRKQHLKSEALTIEALPLPREGQPAGFDAANVGKYTLAARADRTTVSVGEAVTVTLEAKGVGNVRNVHMPVIATPDGWKAYPPKETVTLDAPGGVGGTKVSEVLLLPERAGAVMIPSAELATFDPEAKRYVALKSDPLRLDVTGDAKAAGAPRVAGTGGAAEPSIENVITAAIRPIRARSRLARDVGTTLLRSRAFGWILFLPPFAFGLTVVVERVRERLALDTRRGRRRRMRSLVRQRLRAAEAHREAGRATDFYIEIERVLREVLASRLGRSVTGLRHDELSALLAARGTPAELTARVLAELEACDLARFSPGGQAEAGAAMAETLGRADELIGAVEKAPLREETLT
ncbi:MAG TPA: BatD family protein [Polyangia bacterium]|nr:BatD family protein [Polyangia bacterium]